METTQRQPTARGFHAADSAGPSAARLPGVCSPQPAPPQLTVGWAVHDDEVRDAQRLRWRVFAGEMGARLSPVAGTPPGLDADAFDPHCEHLLVRTVPTVDQPTRVVGTYRVLTPMAAKRAGGLYSDQEFDLSRLDRTKAAAVKELIIDQTTDPRTGVVRKRVRFKLADKQAALTRMMAQAPDSQADRARWMAAGRAEVFAMDEIVLGNRREAWRRGLRD